MMVILGEKIIGLEKFITVNNTCIVIYINLSIYTLFPMCFEDGNKGAYVWNPSLFLIRKKKQKQILNHLNHM